MALNLLLVSLLSMAACTPPSGQKPVALTQTNEQGCTRQRSVGPQDAFADPAPVKQACVGPYLLALPQNYFDNQTGTEHDGSFGLALEYPSLEPFKPGERMHLTADVLTRTVSVDFIYIDRIDVRQSLRNAYLPMDHERDDPAETLDARIQGQPVYGLTPYYADLARIRDYDIGRGAAPRQPAMKSSWYEDWFVTRDTRGEIDRIIKCTSRNTVESGVEYRDGKMVKSRVRELPECDHFLIIPERSTRLRINYVREAMKDWRAIEDRARALFLQGISNRKSTPGQAAGGAGLPAAGVARRNAAR
ncbi:hypothetical protein [Stenotrophomonas sp.]|uniref:hypothetical protein n=1 Tax=Stenotrophomonas sp. TaxID=69392 RepID=UPI002FC69EBB